MSLILNQVLRTNNSEAVFNWRSHRGISPNMGTIAAYGDFSGGTIAASVSFDGGIVYLPLQKITGTDIIFTASGYDNFQLMSGQQVMIKLALTGAATPSITILAFDML